jgi:hypothetical protein
MNIYFIIWLTIIPLIILVGPKGNRWVTVFRFACAALIGWLLLVKGTVYHWDLELLNALTDEEIYKATSGDTGPKAFSAVFGWVPSAMYAGLWIVIFWTAMWIKRKMYIQGELNE